MSRLVGRFRVLLPPAPLIVVYAFVYLVASLPAIIVAQPPRRGRGRRAAPADARS